MRVRIQLKAATLSALILSAWPLATQACTVTSLDEVVSTFQNHSIETMVRCINLVRQHSYSSRDSLLFLHELWKGNQERYPKVNWDAVNKDIVRVNIAGAMVQVRWNRQFDVDDEKLHDYLKRLIRSPDHEVAAQAIRSIHSFDDPDDVDEILAVALKRNEYVFRSAVWALSSMCIDAGAKGLDIMLTQIEDAERTSFITKTRSELKAFNEGSGFCRRER